MADAAVKSAPEDDFDFIKTPAAPHVQQQLNQPGVPTTEVLFASTLLSQHSD